MNGSSENLSSQDIPQTNRNSKDMVAAPEEKSERGELGQAALREFDGLLEDRDSVRRGDIEYADNVGLQIGYVEREVLDDYRLSTDPRVRDNENRLYNIKGVLKELSDQSVDNKHRYISQETRSKIEQALGKLSETPEGSDEALSLGQEAVGLFMT